LISFSVGGRREISRPSLIQSDGWLGFVIGAQRGHHGGRRAQKKKKKEGKRRRKRENVISIDDNERIGLNGSWVRRVSRSG